MKSIVYFNTLLCERWMPIPSGINTDTPLIWLEVWEKPWQVFIHPVSVICSYELTGIKTLHRTSNSNEQQLNTSTQRDLNSPVTTMSQGTEWTRKGEFRIDKSVFEVDMRKKERVAGERGGMVVKAKQKIVGLKEIFTAEEINLDCN